MKRHGQCIQDRTCPACGAPTCQWCARRDGTCDNHGAPVPAPASEAADLRAALADVRVCLSSHDGECLCGLNTIDGALRVERGA